MYDELEIPEFLRRHKGEPQPAWVPSPRPAEPTTDEKWRELERQRKQQKTLKARGRVAKMLSVKADRAAAASGKTWDVQKGVWR